MYATVLSSPEKSILYEAMQFLMQSDGVVGENERQYLDSCAALLGVDVTIFKGGVDYASLTRKMKAMTNPVAKRTIIMELINMAYVDGAYCTQEKADIRKIATVMGLEEKTLQQIENWVAEGIEHAQKWQQLLEEEK